MCRRVRGWEKENTWSHEKLCFAQVYAFARFYTRLLEAVSFRFSDLLHSTASMDLFDPFRSGEKGKETKRIVLSPFWKGREDREEEDEQR